MLTFGVLLSLSLQKSSQKVRKLVSALESIRYSVAHTCQPVQTHAGFKYIVQVQLVENIGQGGRCVFFHYSSRLLGTMAMIADTLLILLHSMTRSDLMTHAEVSVDCFRMDPTFTRH